MKGHVTHYFIISERNLSCRALRTPDWFECVSPMKPQQAQPFDVLGKATTASPSDGRSSSAKSPGETSTIAQRTPDPFEEYRRRFGKVCLFDVVWLPRALNFRF